MPAARMGEQLLAPWQALLFLPLAGSGRFSLFVPSLPLCLCLSLREVGMHACGHPDWGAITFVAGRAGVVEARGGKPCRSYISTWSPRVSGSARLNCTDAVQIGKDRLSCLFVFFVLILLVPSSRCLGRAYAG